MSTKKQNRCNKEQHGFYTVLFYSILVNAYTCIYIYMSKTLSRNMTVLGTHTLSYTTYDSLMYIADIISGPPLYNE